MYKGITAKVKINGTFTNDINILRSVRQGCPLSMSLYALGIEPMQYFIQKEKQINGLKIPNYSNEVKTFQPADDMTLITTNSNFLPKLRKITEQFGKHSGSKINEDKTQILLINKPKVKINDDIDIKLIKKNVKVLGVIYGENQEENFKNVKSKIIQQIKIWQAIPLNMYQKRMVINTYIASKLWYLLKIIKLPIAYSKIPQGIINTYLWNGQEYIKRIQMQQNENKGGFGMINFENKRKAFIIHQITTLKKDKTEIWMKLFIYYLGFNIIFLDKDLASNTYVHTMETPKK